MSLSGLKEVCNKLVGRWYCEDNGELLTFDLNTDLGGTSGTVTVINRNNNFKPFTLPYGVGFYLESTLREEDIFYIDIGDMTKQYYKIESLSKDELIIREYWMKVGVPPCQYVQVYRSVTDTGFADELLSKIDF